MATDADGHMTSEFANSSFGHSGVACERNNAPANKSIMAKLMSVGRFSQGCVQRLAPPTRLFLSELLIWKSLFN